MLRNKKGLSTIVITLLIVLISLVAVGIIWVVIKNLITSGTGGIEFSTKCLNTNIEITKVNCTSVGVSRICDVTLKRTGTGTDPIAGVKLVFKNETSGISSGLISVDGNIEPLIGKTQTGINTTITDVNRVEVTAFFKDASGNEQLCSQTNSFSNPSGF
jgi:hypothetical protein